MIEKDMLNKKIWAVVGANQNPEKYGNMIYRKLKLKGYEAYAVNPIYEYIGEDKCYASLSDLPKLPEVVNIVVSPKRARRVLEEAHRLGIEYIWFQPETYDDDLISYADKLGLITAKACVLVATR